MHKNARDCWFQCRFVDFTDFGDTSLTAEHASLVITAPTLSISPILSSATRGRSRVEPRPMPPQAGSTRARAQTSSSTVGPAAGVSPWPETPKQTAARAEIAHKQRHGHSHCPSSRAPARTNMEQAEPQTTTMFHKQAAPTASTNKQSQRRARPQCYKPRVPFLPAS